ncbi:MAG: precorrin-3B C(17)-methyltransferase, partial [Candidatus Caldatribacteriaceae bacterium]
MGWLKVVSIGPGNFQEITPHALRALKTAEVVVGYKSYLQRITSLLRENVTVIGGGMGEEVKRVQEALKRVFQGQKVCVVSGGDAGIYGMAGLVLESIAREKIELKVEIIPGVSAINAIAAALGAPLNQDFAVISLSDLLVPWETIARRLEAASWGDFVIVLCNP